MCYIARLQAQISKAQICDVFKPDMFLCSFFVEAGRERKRKKVEKEKMESQQENAHKSLLQSRMSGWILWSNYILDFEKSMNCTIHKTCFNLKYFWSELIGPDLLFARSPQFVVWNLQAYCKNDLSYIHLFSIAEILGTFWQYLLKKFLNC